MSEIVVGLDRDRIAQLRSSGHFFWLDLSVGASTRDELFDVLGVPAHILAPLLDFREDAPPFRKFKADGDHVTFVFSAFLEGNSVETHVLVTAEYVLTAHREQVSLPGRLEVVLPDGRNPRYVVYTVLEAMMISAFETLNGVERVLDRIQLGSTDSGAARIRMTTLRQINMRLTTLRRRTAPQRGIPDRVADEIANIRGFESAGDRYFERLGNQLNRLIDAVDAGSHAVAQLIDLRLNETIYWLTVLSTIFLPLTFVTGFFGMNFGWMVKEINTPLAFWLLGVGGCALGVLFTLYVVSRRGTPVDPTD
jgi:magnesium transporter